MKTTVRILFTLWVVFNSACNAQVGSGDAINNRIIIKYFPGFQLESILSNNPELHSELQSYFTSSFIIERSDCKGCDVDYSELLNIELFDVSVFEVFRAPSERVQIEFMPDKYTVTLLSQQELLLLLNGNSFNDLINQSFPKWIDSGDLEADYVAYKSNIAYWATLFPNAYRTITNSNETIKVRFSEFSLMSPQRKSSVFNNQKGYYITD